ncbi:hypothetical protein [Balnearium lithotrophicum]|uniref:hypothetical protein n=1 Tax=Balnearium lithotrophicum TaxID=223788 RepID=UPI00115C4981|nr:hypothetical protein [Balnearium lithotrophicum]
MQLEKQLIFQILDTAVETVKEELLDMQLMRIKRKLNNLKTLRKIDNDEDEWLLILEDRNLSVLIYNKAMKNPLDEIKKSI